MQKTVQYKSVPISKVKLNKENPRTISKESFAKLVKSIKEFPEMLNLRPIIVNKAMIILGGNYRYRAAKEAGLKEVPIIIADNLTEDQENEFIIKDNVGYGEWDLEILSKEWDVKLLEEWGLPAFENQPKLNYDLLNDDSKNDSLDRMQGGVLRALQIEFQPKDYDTAVELTKECREKNIYIGKQLIEKLREVLNKV